jgi:hypothetical protein
MKNKYLGISLAVFVVLFTGYTTYSSNQINAKLADLSLVNIESLAGEDDDIIDGGELGGGGITCSKGGSGRCYQKRVHHEGGDYCSLRCVASGNPADYCNAFWMGILELCINYL